MQVRLRDATATGTVTGELVLDGVPDRITVRDLIRTRVREEVARHNLGTGDYFTGLVQPAEGTDTPRGYKLARPRKIDWEEQADVAEAGFMANRFFVLVGDEQVTELDQVLELSVDTDIRFVKLVPLVGG